MLDNNFYWNILREWLEQFNAYFFLKDIKVTNPKTQPCSSLD